MFRILFAVLAALAFAMPAAAQAPFRLEIVAEGLDGPVFVTAPAGDARLFIVEQTGRIRILSGGAISETPFLDIADRISAGGEQGLLGLAFHSGYAENGRFFVNYTDSAGDTQVVGYTVSGNPDVADPASEEAGDHGPQQRGEDA
jgi:glucose/arabinose dehydrogenase